MVAWSVELVLLVLEWVPPALPVEVAMGDHSMAFLPRDPSLGIHVEAALVVGEPLAVELELDLVALDLVVTNLVRHHLHLLSFVVCFACEVFYLDVFVGYKSSDVGPPSLSGAVSV